MSDQVLLSVPQVQAAPLDYPVPAAQEIGLQTVTGTFDGSGAAGQFLPALQIIGPGGIVAGTFVNPGSPVAAGGDAEVTFGSFLSQQPATSSGGGLQYDVDNSGDWFYAAASASNDQGGYAWEFHDTGADGDGIALESDSGLIYLSAGGRIIIDAGDSASLTAAGITISDSLDLDATVGGALTFTSTGNASLGSVGGSAALSAATVTTLEAGTELDMGFGTKMVINAGADTTMQMSVGFFEVRALYGSSGLGSNVYRAELNADGVHWEHFWWDGQGGHLVMSITWNGSDFDYKIRTGRTWQSVL